MTFIFSILFQIVNSVEFGHTKFYATSKLPTMEIFLERIAIGYFEVKQSRDFLGMFLSNQVKIFDL
tara:strand:- start:2639 stop:2836 length:198 start_codon:yes stop_codon:yes gene_type:complete